MSGETSPRSLTSPERQGEEVTEVPGSLTLSAGSTTDSPGSAAKVSASDTPALPETSLLDRFPLRSEALRLLEADGVEIVHSPSEATKAHGHGGICCCWMGACRSDLCTLNALIVARLALDGPPR